MRADLDGDGLVPFDVEVVEGLDGPVVRVRGEIDMSTTPLLLSALETAAGLGGPLVVARPDATFMDAGGLGVLAGVAKGDGHTMVIRSPNRLIRMLLSVTDLEQILTIEGAT